MALAALCWALASCSDDSFNREYGEGIGYLRLQLGKVDVDLSSTTRAEAGSLPDDLIPQTYDDFMIDIKQGSTSVDDFPKKYSELSEEGIELMAGAYTVTAYYGENEPIQATPYFSGSSTVEIYPGQPTSTTINAALANAMLVPAVSESLQKHYSAWSLKLKAGELVTELANQDKTDGYLFAKADQSVTAVFEGTNILGKETSQEWTISSPAAQTKYVIQCDPDLSIFSNIQLTATATHTYAEGDVLTGTDVTLNIKDNGAPLELVDVWDIRLLYNGTPIRTYEPENSPTMTVVEGWPYVPQGSTLSANIRLKTGETVELTSAVLEEIPQPKFTATVSGSTSYSVYLDPNQGAEVANTKDGSSIFDINATATIAQEILDNYSDLLKVTYTIDDNEQSTKESIFGIPTEFNSLAWQKHTLIATVTFDGVEKTSSRVECDVTGLPYVPSAMVESDWDFASWNCKYENGTIQLGGVSGSGECTATSKMVFYIPENVGIKLNTNVTVRDYFYDGLFFDKWCETTFTTNVNGTTIISQSGDRQDNNNTGKNYTLSGTGTFSPGACEVKLNSSYKEAGPWSKVHTLHILYN